MWVQWRGMVQCLQHFYLALFMMGQLKGVPHILRDVLREQWIFVKYQVPYRPHLFDTPPTASLMGAWDQRLQMILTCLMAEAP